MARDTKPAFTPHLTEYEDKYYVTLKRAEGEYLILSKPTSVSALAKQDLKRIRREMWELWDANRGSR